MPPLEKWISHLKEGIIRRGTTAPSLVEAHKKLRYYSMTPEEQCAYNEYLNAVMIQNDMLDSAAKLEGLLEDRVEDKTEGEKNKQVEIATNLKNMGLPLETIMQATGLFEEEINKL